MTAVVVFNPNSAGGATGRDWQEIENALERVFPALSFFVTAAPAQAAQVVRDALREGCLEIIAVGGDGTINEALNGFFDRGAAVSPDAVFSFVHNGEDGKLAAQFGIAPGWRAGIAHLAKARIRKADVGRVACLADGGAPVTRYFLGSASLGLSAVIARRLGTSRIARFFGHDFARWLHGLIAAGSWRETRVRLMADNHDEIAGIAAVTVKPRDGMFDMTVTAGRGKARLLREIAAGVGRGHRTARLTAAPTVDTHAPVAVETDGESAGRLPATFEIYPAAINLRA